MTVEYDASKNENQHPIVGMKFGHIYLWLHSAPGYLWVFLVSFFMGVLGFLVNFS